MWQTGSGPRHAGWCATAVFLGGSNACTFQELARCAAIVLIDRSGHGGVDEATFILW